MHKFAVWNVVLDLGLPIGEIRTVTTLKRKRDEIASYVKKLGQAKADLAAINSAVRIFEVDGGGNFVAPTSIPTACLTG
jgi:hypothetical protein